MKTLKKYFQKLAQKTLHYLENSRIYEYIIMRRSSAAIVSVESGSEMG